MILFRCDAGADIGAGHFFRLLSLAEYAASQGDEVRMLMESPPSGLVEQAESLGVSCTGLAIEKDQRATLADAAEVEARARRHGAEAVVVDGYHFPTTYYEALAGGARDSGEIWQVAAVDDIAEQPFPVDVLINVNIDADRLNYETRADGRSTKKLLGVEYTMLRRQFRQARERLEARGGPEVPDEIQQVLVSLGGGDPTNETTKVLKGLGEAAYDGALSVLVGPSNPHEEQIRRVGERLDASVTYYQNVSEMAALILGHHLSINAGGGTNWELCCLGVPAIQVMIAENQRRTVEGLDRRGISVNLGWREDVDPGDIAEAFSALSADRARREGAIERGMKLIDGDGVRRIRRMLLEGET